MYFLDRSIMQCGFKGALGKCPTLGPFFFNFMQFSGGKGQNNRFKAPPLVKTDMFNTFYVYPMDKNVICSIEIF